MRLAALQDFILSPPKAEELWQRDDSWNELMALWDVCRDFEEEISPDLPVVNAMNRIRAVRGLGC